MADPLLNEQVDAVAAREPFATVLLDTGRIESIAHPYVEAQPNGDITQYLAEVAWVEKNVALARRFARAILKGNDYVNNSINDAAVREANVAFTNLAPALKDRVLLPRMGTAVSRDEILKTQALMIQYGIMKKPVDLDDRILK